MALWRSRVQDERRVGHAAAAGHPTETVTVVTALRDVVCSDFFASEELMSNLRTCDSWFDAGLVDERNERQVLIALVASVFAWLTLFVVALA